MATKPDQDAPRRASEKAQGVADRQAEAPSVDESLLACCEDGERPAVIVERRLAQITSRA